MKGVRTWGRFTMHISYHVKMLEVGILTFMCPSRGEIVQLKYFAIAPHWHYRRGYPTKSFIHSLTGFSSALSFMLTVPVSYVCPIYSQFPWLSDLPSDC